MMEVRFVEPEKKQTFHAVFSPAPFCEHCRALEPFTATISEDDVEWCIDCFQVNNQIPEVSIGQIKSAERQCKIQYYQRKINQLMSS